MAEDLKSKEEDPKTEEKIKSAARKIFQQKGFAGARTRDIAEEAGINLALLNYYFRSKEKLFELIMEESVRDLFTIIVAKLNDEEIDLGKKIDLITELYFNKLEENPNVPLFIMSAIQANPEKFKDRIGLKTNFLTSTVLYKQIETHLKQIGKENINPIHIFINTVSLVVFPFAAKPLLNCVVNFSADESKHFMKERRTLVPVWIKSMLEIK